MRDLPAVAEQWQWILHPEHGQATDLPLARSSRSRRACSPATRNRFASFESQLLFQCKERRLGCEIVCPDERGCSQADTRVRTWVAATRTTSCQIGDNQWQGARPRKTRVQPCTRTGHFWGYWQTRPSEPCRSSRALRCSMLPFGRGGLSELRLSGI